MIATRVEKIIIGTGHVNHMACYLYCSAARKVANSALYQLRQALIVRKNPISACEADKILKTEYRDIYTLLPAAGAQRMTQIVGDSWSSWLAAKEDFKVNPHKYKGQPKIPGYSKGIRTYVVNRNGYKIKDGMIHLSGAKKFGFQPIRTTVCDNQPFNEKEERTVVTDVRIVPLGTSFCVEVVYKKEVKEQPEIDPEKVFSIDLGIDNLVTIVSNQQGYAPVLVKGKALKSVNAKYNKDKADLAKRGKQKHILSKSRRRYCRINDFMHKVSKWVVDEAVRTSTGRIIIGKNADWKQKVNMGKVNNQKFTHIPHARLIEMISYKARELGIEVTLREESYTSKASALDLDPIPVYGEVSDVEKNFSGKRVKRGLYRTANGKTINADVNGSANIMRKEIGDEWLKTHLEVGRGVVDTPVRIRHICAHLALKDSQRAVETPSK